MPETGEEITRQSLPEGFDSGRPSAPPPPRSTPVRLVSLCGPAIMTSSIERRGGHHLGAPIPIPSRHTEAPRCAPADWQRA
ncbi:MAG TPA: hypothetical protein VE338_15820, partial [Ktedonobacterales bacterium]|nr:hypothetical protein [Ktedonobacterales bacterium]